jgi:hypothetical protein
MSIVKIRQKLLVKKGQGTHATLCQLTGNLGTEAEIAVLSRVGAAAHYTVMGDTASV